MKRGSMQNFEDLKRQAIEAVLTQNGLSVTPSGVCLYRGPNKTHCVVGHFIRLAGGEINRVVEGRAYWEACRQAGLHDLSKDEIVELCRIQKAHDRCAESAFDREGKADLNLFRERFREALAMEAT